MAPDLAGIDWPNRHASRFVEADGLRWHVQVMGRGPVLLLLHGTGAATHTWRDLAPLLAESCTVIAPDLPGHGFTRAPSARWMSIDGMAGGLAALLRALALEPELAAGHSAGAALLARLALDRRIAPRLIVSLNGAFMPLAGWLRVMSPAARLLAKLPAVPKVVAGRAGRDAAVDRLIASTGSTIDAAGRRCYAQLLRDPAHVGGALSMMANWQLAPLWNDLPRLAPKLRLLVGTDDLTLPPDQAWRVAERVPGATVESLPGLGHLAHEERPHDVAGRILRYAGESRVPAGAAA
jgi:magnesium chelatase accessory protein